MFKIGASRRPYSWNKEAIIGVIVALLAAFLSHAGAAFSSTYLACEKDRDESNRKVADNEHAMYLIRLRRIELGVKLLAQRSIVMTSRDDERIANFYKKSFDKIKLLSEEESFDTVNALKDLSLEEMSRNVDVEIRKWKAFGAESETTADQVSDSPNGFLSQNFYNGYKYYQYNKLSLKNWFRQISEDSKDYRGIVDAFILFSRRNAAGDDQNALDDQGKTADQILFTNNQLVAESELGMIPRYVCRDRALRAVFFLSDP